MSSNCKSTSSEVLFSVRNNEVFFSSNDTDNDRNPTDDVQADEFQLETDVILSIIWKGGKIGAAYYTVDEHQLYVLKDTADFAPQFPSSRTLYSEIVPSYIVTFGTTCDEYTKFIIDLINSKEDTTTTSNEARSTPANLSLLSLKNYSYEACETAVSQLINSFNDLELTDSENQIVLHSLINLDNTLSVHALGALIKFLEKNWGNFNKHNEPLSFWQIAQTTLKDNVLMDQNTIKGLQIFQARSHEANFKHGLMSSNREGISIFKLFSRYCNSYIGKCCLKNILLKPLKDIDELNKRLDFIEFATKPINRNLIESFEDNIKKMWDLNSSINKIENSRANTRDWECLQKTIYHMTVMYELCIPYVDQVALFYEYGTSMKRELYSLLQSIGNAIDFDTKYKSSRPKIKFGLDKALDAKKLMRKDIGKRITAAANFAMTQLPSYLNECTMVYIPERGHLITFKEWEPDCDYNDLQMYGFQFIFKMHDVLHFKNPLCVELDNQLGDIHSEIIAHETRIIKRLSGFVVKYNRYIREPLGFVALFDSLIAMSKVAIANSYVRPALNLENVHEITESRHPLMEFTSSTFEPNNFYSGGINSRMKIITGPNGSGKSVYLKQIALIIYLGHIGSFVPAKKANIGMVHSIHSRIHSTESASVHLSSFMIDLCQMAQALYNCTASSLILIDEFGRGTTGEEGMALLLGALKKFLKMKENCPHILVSTHFQQISNYIPKSQFVNYLQMEYTIDGRDLLFLFRVVEGVSHSFAVEVAASVIAHKGIVERAHQILHCLRNGEPIQTLPEISRKYPIEKTTNVDFYQNLTLPELDD